MYEIRDVTPAWSIDEAGSGGLQTTSQRSAEALQPTPRAATDRLERDKPPGKAEQTIAIIDSRSLTREGLVSLLHGRERFRVLAVSSPAELLSRADLRDLQIGTILFNVGTLAVSSDGVRQDIHALMGAIDRVAIILVSDREDSQQIGEALRQGVRGYIPTTLTPGILIEAVRLVQAGGTFVPADALAEALNQRQPVPGSDPAELDQLNLSSLTPRQREVLELLRRGKPNKIIAHELSMRESTVKVHVRQIMRKLRARNRTQAAFLAARVAGTTQD